MNKLKIGIIFGGMSTEHDVSIVSGKSIIEHLNKDKYEIFPIYIDKEGIWYSNNQIINNIIEFLKNLDVVFPILHGKYGEDGTIQGMLELLKIPFVGCGVLASSIAMDKVYSKIIFDKAKIKQAQYVYLRKNKDEYIYIDDQFNQIEESLESICEKISKKLKFPMFVKPSNSGSSVGINKAKNKEELEKYIEYASKFDSKVLVEEGIEGREIECSVLGNENVKASCVGEIKPSEEFYTYDAKYKDSNSILLIPAPISEEISNKVKEIAIKAFKAIDGRGFARIDLFVNDKTNEVYINEINTLPGFTPISMYPKLWENDGMEYNILLDELINTAVKK